MAFVDTLREVYAAFGRGDVPAILARLAEEVEWEHDSGMELIEPLRPRRGRAEVPGFFAALGALQFLRFEPYGFLGGPDMVTVLIHVHLRHRETGRELRDIEAHLRTFGPDGLVRRMGHFLDTRQFAWTVGATQV